MHGGKDSRLWTTETSYRESLGEELTSHWEESQRTEITTADGILRVVLESSDCKLWYLAKFWQSCSGPNHSEF